jgi:hypothetical protein
LEILGGPALRPSFYAADRMSTASGAAAPIHDRAYLLGSEKRNDVLALWEVARYGSDSFGDPDYLTLYGRKPADWYARGVRLLARTAVECTRDLLADRIGRDVAALADDAPAVGPPVVVDPFAGSANTLYWLARHAAARQAIGCELDSGVFEATRRNLSILGLSIELSPIGYEAGLETLRAAPDEPLIVFVAPPWGDALSPEQGLDLGKTQPPVPTIIDCVSRVLPNHKILLAIQVHESVTASSVNEVRSRLDWSALKVYDIDAAGQNHGLIVGTLNWAPSDSRVRSDASG